MKLGLGYWSPTEFVAQAGAPRDAAASAEEIRVRVIPPAIVRLFPREQARQLGRHEQRRAALMQRWLPDPPSYFGYDH